MTKTASQMLTELRAEGFFGHVHEPGVRCWACEVDLVLAAEPNGDSHLREDFEWLLKMSGARTWLGWWDERLRDSAEEPLRSRMAAHFARIRAQNRGAEP